MITPVNSVPFPKGPEKASGESRFVLMSQRKGELQNGVAPSDPSKGIPSVVFTLAETVRDLRK